MHNDILGIVARPEGVHKSFMDNALDGLTSQEQPRESVEDPPVRANPKRPSRYADVTERLERQRREVREKHLREWLPEIEAYPGPGFCYFIEDAQAGLIKIGYSRQPVRRLKELQRDTPCKLTLLAQAPGGRERERYYHAKFRERARGGEWFERCPEILSEVERLNAVSLAFPEMLEIHSLFRENRAQFVQWLSGGKETLCSLGWLA